MNPKYKEGQKVKFNGDHDRMTGKVLSVSWNSTDGFMYQISSKYYDPSIGDMVEGVKTCREAELVDMSDYDGTTTPEVPQKTVDLTDKVTAETETEEHE